MDIFVRFEFHHGQPPVASHGENVNHSPIGSGKCGHLRVQAGGIQAFVHGTDVAHVQGFEPAFRMQPPQCLVA